MVIFYHRCARRGERVQHARSALVASFCAALMSCWNLSIAANLTCSGRLPLDGAGSRGQEIRGLDSIVGPLAAFRLRPHLEKGLHDWADYRSLAAQPEEHLGSLEY
jgi:hypothetical protein